MTREVVAHQLQLMNGCFFWGGGGKQTHGEGRERKGQHTVTDKRTNQKGGHKCARGVENKREIKE